jgi:hypothetical protein
MAGSGPEVTGYMNPFAFVRAVRGIFEGRARQPPRGVTERARGPLPRRTRRTWRSTRTQWHRRRRARRGLPPRPRGRPGRPVYCGARRHGRCPAAGAAVGRRRRLAFAAAGQARPSGRHRRRDRRVPRHRRPVHLARDRPWLTLPVDSPNHPGECRRILDQRPGEVHGRHIRPIPYRPRSPQGRASLRARRRGRR